MKFGDKLFFATTAILTVIFTIFGMWMLSSYFQRLLSREIEQGKTESQMYQHLFTLVYQSMEEYGDAYAVPRAIGGVVVSIEKEGVQCFAVDGQGNYEYARNLAEIEGFTETVNALMNELQGTNSYTYMISRLQDNYYLIMVSECAVSNGRQYLGVCRDLTEVYTDREKLLNHYRFALVVLLFVGGISIFALSRWITRPIQSLGRVAGQIAAGNLEQRSFYEGKDEIGDLAASFNSMADRLVTQMQEKELEARQQEDFTAAFAHELKTPLTSIIGYADMLGTIQLTEEERQEAYIYIYSQGKRLESLSHKLLELVSLEKHPINKKPIAAKQLEEMIRTTMRPIFKERSIRGKIDLEKGTIMGDYELLLSLFYNLLDNAVKAVGEDGFILLKGCKLENAYEIKVVDNGCGMPKQEIPRITEAFYMVDKSRSRKEGGAGIGMTLCKKVAKLHGITINIDSNPGEGTVVRLLFPIEKEKEKCEHESKMES